jgi:ubiquinone/menaquinone biosynthesis C-methylase UbiE
MDTARSIGSAGEVPSGRVRRFDPRNPEPAADAPDFSRLAEVYCWLEWLSFGPFLWRCRCAFLGTLSGSRKALVIGDGDGRFTARLLAENSSVQIDALDASSGMLTELMRTVGQNACRVRPILGDARISSTGSSHYDLIATHFFLDCLATDEVHALAVRLRRCVEPNARWIVSDFAVPAGLFGRAVARPVIAALYRTFGALTGLKIQSLPDHHWALNQAGFSIVQKRRWLFGLLVSEMWVPNHTQRSVLRLLAEVPSLSSREH